MPIDFTDFHFLRPAWLVLLLVFALLCWRLLRRRDAGGVWQSICDEALLPYVLVQRRTSRGPLNLGLFVTGGIAAIIALAGPTWERLPSPVFRDGSALVLLLDLSRSMDAADISPSRLERAKFKIMDILRQRREGQTALIVYAAEPYVVTPLTNDVATIESQLPALRTGIMPSQGSAGASAIERGIELLGQAGLMSGELILITDGLDLAELENAKRSIAGAKASVRLSILGVGTTGGAPIPDSGGGFIKDARGNIILERLRPTHLRELASVGRGLYRSVRTDDKDISVFLTLTENNLNQRNTAVTDLFADRWREFGPWLLLGLIPFAPLAFRRGILTLIVTIGIAAATYPDPASAGWWSTPDQEASRRFEQGDFASAAETFENAAWRASAHYRAGNYEAAADIPADADVEYQYNRGNALARLGRLEDAIGAYDETLTRIPDHEDALYNKALLEELLQQQEPEQQREQQANASNDAETSDQGGGTGDPPAGEASEKPADNESQDAAASNNGQEDRRESSTSAEEKSEEQLPTEESKQTVAADQIDEEVPAVESTADPQAQANSTMENEQATEQWLRQIPDDPGGLLRRKFEYEYQKKYGRGAGRAQTW